MLTEERKDELRELVEGLTEEERVCVRAMINVRFRKKPTTLPKKQASEMGEKSRKRKR